MNELQANKEFLSVLSVAMGIAAGLNDAELMKDMAERAKAFASSLPEHWPVHIRSLMNFIEHEGAKERSESSQIVAWCEQRNKGFVSFYEVFDSPEDAEEKYEEVLKVAQLHSASIFGGVIRSTDYS